MSEIFIFLGGAILGGLAVWYLTLSSERRRIQQSFDRWTKLAEKYQDTKRID